MGLINRLFGSRPQFEREALENKKNASRQDRRRNVVAKTCILLSLTTITVLAFQRGQNLASTVRVGDSWQRETLVAPFDYAIFKSEDSLQAERDRVRFTTEPIFHEDPTALEEMLHNHETVAQQLDEIFGAYRNWRVSVEMARLAAENNDSTQLEAFLASARRDSILHVDLRRNAHVKLTDEQWRLLGEDYLTKSPELPEDRHSDEVESPLYETLLDQVFTLSTPLNTRGVLNIPYDSVFTDYIIVRDTETSTFESVHRDDIFDLNDVWETVQSNLEDVVPRDSGLGIVPTKFVQAVFVPSLKYQLGPTVRKVQEAQRSISPTRGKVAEGEIVIREGEQVTPETKQKLISYEISQRGRVVPALRWKRALAEIILALSTFSIFFLYLFMARRRIFNDNKKMLLMAILYAAIIGLFAVAIRTNADFMYAVPVVTVSVLLTVMFDSRVGLFGTLALALLGGLILGYDYEFFYVTLFGGTLGVFSVRDIRYRSQFFLSAAFAFVGYAVAIAGSWLFLESTAGQLLSNLLMAGISSFLLVMAYPLLWIFERSFDITTDLTLLELSDVNHQLLKDLSLRAPGSFNHSLQVANLAEAAAAAIGANALLTRVGALYHDTGKMMNPEYFVENQRQSFDPHKDLSSEESAMIIKEHVVFGLELGRKARLPHRVLEFVPTHHGTSRVEYFWRQALDDSRSDDLEPNESTYRYDGPRPHTKETAILMLADGIEAASRSLEQPTHDRIKDLIEHIVTVRIEDGQLDEAPLTFSDLNRIKETFLSIQLGVYHLRIKYPGQPKEG